MIEAQEKPWLGRFACFTAAATLALITIGGLVTSNGAGMAVPDWPTSYGYNMFALPVHFWRGGVFYEHTHRLWASFVGALVVGLTRWLGGRRSRWPLAIIGLAEVAAGFAMLAWWPALKGAGYFLTGIGGVVLLAALAWFRNPPAARPLPALGWLVFGLVQLQGLLGGLRVVLFSDQIGILHAALAQVFFVLLCVIALFTRARWRRLAGRFGENAATAARAAHPGAVRHLFFGATALVFCQLLLGATMRHQHAGLAIPDFPLAYHKLWPPMDSASVAAYNADRREVVAANPITPFQIGLQMAHRLMAVLILGAVAASAWQARRRLGPAHPLARSSLVWLGLILAQAVLGAFTIWTNKAADVATAHVVLGALSLAGGSLLTVAAFQVLIPARAAGLAPVIAARPGLAAGQPAAAGSK